MILYICSLTGRGTVKYLKIIHAPIAYGLMAIEMAWRIQNFVRGLIVFTFKAGWPYPLNRPFLNIYTKNGRM